MLSNRFALPPPGRPQVRGDERTARISAFAAELKCQVRKDNNFLNAEYRKSFVELHWEQILCDPACGDAWEREYKELFAADGDLVFAVKKEAPEVIELFEARMDMILESERIKIANDIKLAQNPPPPTFHFYQELIDKINRGEHPDARPLVDRVKDLCREEGILQAKRRADVRESGNRIGLYDNRLVVLRREKVHLTEALEKIGMKDMDLKEAGDREPTLAERLLAEYR